MADAKTTQLTQLAATPATNDLVMIVDVSDTTMAASGTNKRLPANYMARSNADATLIAGDGKTLTLPAMGTALLSGALALVSGVSTGITGSVADDNVFSFAPADTQAMLLIWALAVGGISGTRAALVNYRAASTPHCGILAQGGTAFEAATGAMAGTTGTDGKVTISAANDGKIYIENRSGVSLNHQYLIVG